MGYSASANALDRLNMIMVHNHHQSSNTWINKGNEFFYEIGREQNDGAVTGTVYQVRGKLAYKKGSFRIEGNGHVTRFPSLSKEMRAASKATLPMMY